MIEPYDGGVAVRDGDPHTPPFTCAARRGPEIRRRPPRAAIQRDCDGLGLSRRIDDP